MTSRPITIDTNSWFALLNKRDRMHRIAVSRFAAMLHQRCSILLTDWSIAETENGLARTPARRTFRSAVHLLLADARTTLITIDEKRTRQALNRYDERPDKTRGLIDCSTDCSTMLVMEEFGSTEAFTSDRHFVQAGFVALLGNEIAESGDV